ncbi:nif-specific transcriptional activator NifA [Vibrio plantisponsor]|uniref:Nif-specific regulatory protein n=1 Tax=Vibrio plantisponsor TaxID=664643 RepID=A0ABU4IMN6_9VIBR|nr:nif-specific transcriptional activator NifA [Vibrio plantisponsor]MDW6019675.1 nif-specific transcriptional activator NifA [Vibrio plantisponsor]NNM38995.1 nif-specific transcriptional activator NifA [Vibrio plantisponsor]
MTDEMTLLNLERRLLAAMYKISSVLNTSLNYVESSDKILQVLHDECALQCGMLTILDSTRDILLIKSVHSPQPNSAAQHKQVSYKIGEGLVGEVLRQGSSIVLHNLGSDQRFADKLALYDYEKPFICVPLKDANGKVIGALSAQPPKFVEGFITLQTNFLNMIANLIAKNVQLAYKVETHQQQLVDERDNLRRKVRNNYSFRNLVGHTKSMRQIFEQIRLVSRWDSTVLIRGESGTGKELVANAIHYNSPRANLPFVKLNCAALPDNLLESELFGHEKGAFTGAVKQRKGRFEMADNGTIFLDEIGETSPAFQAKLLRVLQEKEFERVGGTTTISVNVRIIAATNRYLEQEVAQGNFREDLYYRLNVMPMYLPPLRERLQDIPELAEHMIQNLSKAQQRKLTLSDEAIRLMMSHPWPGNVRELENTLERASVLCESGVIGPELITLNKSQPVFQPPVHQISNYLSPNNPVHHQASHPAHHASTNGASMPDYPHSPQDMPTGDERDMVIDALERSGWVKAKAARLLNMTPRQIAYRIQIMNIEMKQI